MAERYGFDYEFVTYKWPNWLHKQVGVGLDCSGRRAVWLNGACPHGARTRERG